MKDAFQATYLELSTPRSAEITPAMIKAGASVIEWDEGAEPDHLALKVYCAMRRALWRKPMDDE